MIYSKIVVATEPNEWRVIDVATGETVFSTTDFAEFEAFCATNADKFE